MLAVICHLWGERYDEGHVRALRSMAAVHIRVPHRFVCLTDRERIEGVETLPLTQVEASRGGRANFAKLAAFGGDLQRSLGSRIVCMDLDTVILGDMTELVMDCGDFAIMEGTRTRAGGRLAPYNSSIWVCEAGARDHFWSGFDVERITELDEIRMDCGKPVIGSDQVWIAHVSPGERTIGETEGLYQFCSIDDVRRISGARAVFFAGSVKPWSEAVSQFWHPLWEAQRMHAAGLVRPYGHSQRCLILGYAESVWEEAYAAGNDFGAVIASPEVARHRAVPGWAWGDIDAVAQNDEHALSLAHVMGFGPDQIVFAGRQKAEAAA